MKLLHKDFALNQTGTVKIIPQEPNDLQVVYNLIATRDIVTVVTTHKFDTTSCVRLPNPYQTSQSEKKSDSGVFFGNIFNAFVKHVDFGTIKIVLIASNVPTKDGFRRFLLSEPKRLKVKAIENKKSRIVVAECKRNLKQVLNDKGAMNKLKDSKVMMEIMFTDQNGSLKSTRKKDEEKSSAQFLQDVGYT
ncbi:protein PELOTA 1-like [Neltuma alba]|uniref:protein PELOTA 1-like n=1 Tax=Neltuma alba TaxID=207710 RepID=UPI0010A344C4|nr:protein PELOTA 1-like [Prosopis alba]